MNCVGLPLARDTAVDFSFALNELNLCSAVVLFVSLIVQLAVANREFVSVLSKVHYHRQV